MFLGLENQRYFFNNKPTELDALVFGHLFSILTTALPGTYSAVVLCAMASGIGPVPTSYMRDLRSEDLWILREENDVDDS